MMEALNHPGDQAMTTSLAAEATIPFPVLAEPTVVHVSKLSSEAVSRCNLGDVEYVVIEPAQDGMRLRPAGIEDQVHHEQEAGLGHVTYSLGEFLDECTNAPSHPAPTFERLARVSRSFERWMLTPASSSCDSAQTHARSTRSGKRFVAANLT